MVNNARFLILPWVQVKNLAPGCSRAAAAGCRRTGTAAIGYRPLLLETFVQSDRIVGTSYRAAVHVRKPKAAANSVHNQHALPKKDIWLYVRRDFRRRLCAPLDPHSNQ